MKRVRNDGERMWHYASAEEAHEHQMALVKHLIAYGVLAENAQATKDSPLFWSPPVANWGWFGERHLHLWSPNIRPRWTGVPVIVLNLSLALELKREELLDVESA